MTVSLSDQFETRSAMVKKCLRFCVPVSKNDAPILHPEAHLTCDKLVRDPAENVPPFSAINVNTQDQFGPLPLRVRSLPHLWAPSLQESGSASGAFLE